MAKLGREFEEAVYNFVQTLDSSAEVLFDYTALDRDSRTPRQCDVWINAKFGRHWPISILVSCKDHKKKLDVGHIGAFYDEVRSTGASTGVIYSTSGFTKPALKKAIVNGLSCCRLYKNEPPDIPTPVWFNSFACSPSLALTLIFPTSDPDLKIWNDVFNIGFTNSNRTMLDRITDIYHDQEQKNVDQIKETSQFPENWAIDIKFSDQASEKLHLRMHCMWKKYQGKLEASLVNGSYCITNDSFHGSQCMPWIDTKSEHPGDSWTEISKQEFNLPDNRIIAVLYHGNVIQALREELGPKLINI